MKKNNNYCFIWSFIRHINPQDKNPNRIKLSDKELFKEIHENLKDFQFPLEINKNKIKKIEDILKVNITILASDEKYNIFPMFVSENIYKNDLNLFNYQNNICYIKDINKLIGWQAYRGDQIHRKNSPT